jgi:Domain of unknown function (DUF1906)
MAIPAFAATAAQTTEQTTISTTGKTTAMKTVVYHGYEFQVPASWPVYRLDRHPTTCVRYDVHAVYLGTPGVNMQCPAGLVGRTQTVSVIPSTAVAAGSGSTTVDQRQQPDGIGGTEVAALPAVRGAVTQNSADHELRVALGAASLGATVVATYGTDPAVVQQVLGTLRAAPARAAQTPQSASAAPSRSNDREGAVEQRTPAVKQSAAVGREAAPASVAGAGKTSPKTSKPSKKSAKSASKAKTVVYKNWRGLPPNWPVQIVLPPPVSPPAVHPVNGFDSCTAPSIATMRVWRQQYAAVGVYIGGANSACAYGNLSAAWIGSAVGMGWGVLPTYVGPQAPCWGYQGAVINPSKAAAEGRTAGADAVSNARLFGLAAGSPIYYDMEAYIGGQSCTDSVLTFLSAWDKTVVAKGYLTGVYSSEDSGIRDLQAAAVGGTAGFIRPDAIWIALWDGKATLDDGTLDWPLADRAKQYAGNLQGTVGGITLSIDRDLVGAPLAH